MKKIIPHEMRVDPEDRGVGYIVCSCGWTFGYPVDEIAEDEALVIAETQHRMEREEAPGVD